MTRRSEGHRDLAERGNGVYRHAPEQLVRVMTRSDDLELPIFGPLRLKRTATKQASKKEIRDAQPLLRRDSLG